MSLDDLVKEFEAQTEQEQRTSIFTLLMTFQQRTDEGMRQLTKNQQDIVNYINQRGIRPAPKKSKLIV